MKKAHEIVKADIALTNNGKKLKARINTPRLKRAYKIAEKDDFIKPANFLEYADSYELA